MTVEDLQIQVDHSRYIHELSYRGLIHAAVREAVSDPRIFALLFEHDAACCSVESQRQSEERIAAATGGKVEDV